MPRESRQPAASGVYHVMVRGIDKQQLFEDDYDNMRFLQIVDTVAVDEFEVLAFCLMGNHVHLLVRVPHGENGLAVLEKAMKSIGIRYVSHYNKRYRRNGSLFQGRFTSQPVESKTYFLRVLRYIHANPVKAGITVSMGEYAYSSYLDYFGNRKPLCRVCTQYALQLKACTELLSWHSLAEARPQDFTEDVQALLRITDEAASTEICALVGCAVPSDISRMAPSLRCTALNLLAHLPVSERQLSRLTGISRGVISRSKLI